MTTGVPAITVRAATADDAPGIAKVHVASWREAYVRQLPAEVLAGLDVQRRAQTWSSIIESGDTRVWVAEMDGAIVGWASAGAGRDAEAPVPLELEGIYLLASAHGSGAGRSLLDAAVGTADAYLWVMADNPRAHAFYRKNGFAADGAAKVEQVGEAAVEVVRLVRAR
ncbi:GNAT family N-acetyltransferase [Leifsonia naganoensis]|uniref:L-amino acid N-acyltransferase YncA n=1 Tax=Leifsonia naganoensis TaxID=150025 RepID=A0A853DVX4_9MICO|nr:GNAT family N-acetyltransferase [Leifsonia naganoensis]NYK12063.1 L-amino acid N-acyltransferase YncA [Leifsonia naganoensis]